MSLRPQEIVRSEVEGGLSGPANSLTAESIDCGCVQYRLPGLVKFATRRIFLGILCSIGVLQAAVQAYFYVTSSTIARRFQIDPYVMGWIIYLADVTPIFVGLAVAYWGDRIHRAAWLGALSLVQCAGLLACITPHLSNWVSVIEQPENVTHMSIYSEESPELCMRMAESMRVIASNDVQLYSTLVILVIMQLLSGIATVAYYALGLSYLDDNTKKIHISVYFGVAIATKALGSIIGYILGWTYLRIDANDFSPIESYQYQIGAWWLGYPIFAVLLAIPSILMSIFPRKLPSEMVQQAAATILDQSGTMRNSQRITAIKVGSTHFIPSILRLVGNKILICNVIAAALVMTAVTNFIANENYFFESRFYAPRPTGMLLGFGDPLLSRLVTTTTKPILIGLIVIISGLLIGRAKPKARTLITYSLVISVVSAIIIFGLAFNDCHKAPIAGSHRREHITLIKYCNKNCRCSQDADFRPVCDSRNSFTFYSPCHAGCTSVSYENNIKLYSNCSCVEEVTGLGNSEAREGPCGSDSCQIGWLIYEVFTVLVYTALASTIVGDSLVSLRSVNVQDKALTIGYSLTLFGFLAYIPGKIGYDFLVNSTCRVWGSRDKICHLHGSKLGSYLCFLTASLILASALFKVGVWLFCPDVEMYDPDEESEQQPTEMKNMSTTQAEPLLQMQQVEPEESIDNQAAGPVPDSTDATIENSHLKKSNGPITSTNDEEASGSRLKYGPLGPGDRRTDKLQSSVSVARASTDDDLDSSDASQGPSKNSQVSYKPLELDSDNDSELSGAARNRKAIPHASLDELSRPPQRIKPLAHKRFPNPDNYDDPRLIRNSRHNSPNDGADGSSRTDSFEYARPQRPNENLSASRGDFNEIGIPLVNSYPSPIKGSTSSLRNPTIMMAVQQLDTNSVRELFDDATYAYKSPRKTDIAEMEENRKFRLEKLMQPVEYSPPAARPASRGQVSSGFGSLQDMRERLRLPSDVSDSRDSLSSKTSEPRPRPKKGSPLCTDL